MKILYVVSRPLEINTSSSIRNRATILGLVANGYDVELLTTEPDRNHSEYDDSLSIEDVPTTYIRLEGTQTIARFVRRLKFLDPLRKLVHEYVSKKNVYDNLKSIVNHTSQIDLRESNFDLIISSSDPKSSHLFVSKLLEQQGGNFKGKWIQIWGDPFFADITRKNKKNSKRIQMEEKSLLAKADSIIYVSQPTLNKQKELYTTSAHKMRYVPIPYMEEKIHVLRRLDHVGTVKLAYCGDYNQSVRNLHPLYDAICCMKGVHLTICGGSDSPMKSCENVTVLGRVPYKKVIKIEEDADILVHLSNLKGTQIPGKIYQYSGTNKPILFILDGQSDAIHNQFKNYNRYSFTVNNVDSINSTINQIIKCADSYEPIKDFDKQVVAKKIVTSIEEN